MECLSDKSENEVSDPLIADREPRESKLYTRSSIRFSLTVSGPNLVSWAETGNESRLTMINWREMDRCSRDFHLQ